MFLNDSGNLASKAGKFELNGEVGIFFSELLLPVFRTVRFSATLGFYAVFTGDTAFGVILGVNRYFFILIPRPGETLGRTRYYSCCLG